MKAKGLMLRIGSTKGLTLIEVLLALVIMGLIISITLPNFNQLLESVDQKAARRQMVNLFNKLQRKAVTAAQIEKVRIENNRLIYRNSAGEKTVFGRGMQQIKLEKGSNPLSFYPNGSSSGVQLLLITNNGNKIKIEVDKITGQTTVEEVK